MCSNERSLFQYAPIRYSRLPASVDTSVHSSPSRLMVPTSSTHTKRASVGTSFSDSELPYDVVRATTPPTSLPLSPTSVIRWEPSRLFVSASPSPLPDIPAESTWYPAKQWIPNGAGHDTYMDYNRSPHLELANFVDATSFCTTSSSNSKQLIFAPLRHSTLYVSFRYSLHVSTTLAVSCRIILSEVSDPPIKGQTRRPNK
ncbi:hypothetical protein R3P38DRAFT_3027399, partial [Favolaschia claudopus]